MGGSSVVLLGRSGTTYKNGRWQPMGSSSPALSNMQFLVLLSAVALAFASPIPEEGMEAPEALAYVHDATGDVAVADSPAALPYVHDATGDVADAASPEAEAYVHDVTGDVAEPYVHVEPVVAPVVATPAVTYAAYPYTYGAYPYLAAGAHHVVAAPAVAEVKAAAAPAFAPVTYAAYPHAYHGYAGYPYAVAAYHAGCVNNVGSVVPCA